MLTFKELPEELKKNYQQFKESGADLYDIIEAAGTQRTVAAGTDLFGAAAQNSAVFIRTGMFKLLDGDVLVRTYSTGDFVPVRSSPRHETRVLRNDEDAEVILFSNDIFSRIARKDNSLYSRYVELLKMDSDINIRLCRLLMEQEITPDFTITTVSPGETIITEGDDPDYIFEMVAGTAAVFKDNERVGEISTGEVFGEISFLTETSRSATVKADTECLIRRVDDNDFFEMAGYNPQLMVDVSRRLAERIRSLNVRLAEKEIEIMI